MLSNLFLLIGLVLAVCTARAASNSLQFLWSILFALGCFIFLGEEISWGQHYMKWVPPESWAEMNRQHETNIHNLKGWPEFLLGKVARNGLSIAMIVGAVIAPWWLRRNQQLCQPGSINFWLWPSSQSAFVAVLAVASNIPKRLMKNFGVEIPYQYYGPNDGELKECLFAYFILLYAIVLFRTLRKQAGR